MGFKSTTLLISMLMITMWTIAFFIGQVLPYAMAGADNTTITVNWDFYFNGLIVLIVSAILIIALHVLTKLVHSGEQFIA